MILSTAFLIIYSLCINWKLSKTKTEVSFARRINAIYDGSRTDSFTSLNFHVYGMIRRVYLVAVLICLKEDGLTQIICYMAQSYIYTLYIFYWKPLEDRRQMKIELFNESMILFASQTLFAFTDFSGEVFSPESKYNFGWYLCGLMLITVGLNIIIALYD
jgi:hypothetical protein